METPWTVQRKSYAAAIASGAAESKLDLLVERCSLLLGLSKSSRAEVTRYIREEGIDLYTALTACFLQCVPSEVSALSRLEIKSSLFGVIYGSYGLRLSITGRELRAIK